MSALGSWALVGFVFLVLWAFWLWLGFMFDAISDYQAAAREARREAAQARKGKGSS